MFSTKPRSTSTSDRPWDWTMVSIQDEEDEDWTSRPSQSNDLHKLIQHDRILTIGALDTYFRQHNLFHSSKDIVTVIMDYIAPMCLVVNPERDSIQIGVNQTCFLTLPREKKKKNTTTTTTITTDGDGCSSSSWWDDQTVLDCLNTTCSEMVTLTDLVVINKTWTQDELDGEHTIDWDQNYAQWNCVQTLLGTGFMRLCHIPQSISSVASVHDCSQEDVSTCLSVHLGYENGSSWILPFYEGVACRNLGHKLSDDVSGINITDKFQHMIENCAQIVMSFEDFRRTKKDRWNQLAHELEKKACDFLMNSQDNFMKFDLPLSGHGLLTRQQVFECMSYHFAKIASQIAQFFTNVSQDDEMSWYCDACRFVVVSVDVPVPWLREQLQAELTEHMGEEKPRVDVILSDDWMGAHHMTACGLNDENWIGCWDLVDEDEEFVRRKSSADYFCI